MDYKTIDGVLYVIESKYEYALDTISTQQCRIEALELAIEKHLVNEKNNRIAQLEKRVKELEGIGTFNALQDIAGLTL